MRGVTDARLDRGHRLFVSRAAVTDRHAMTGRGETAHEIESAVDLRRHRHDAHLLAVAGDDGENLLARESPSTRFHSRCATADSRSSGKACGAQAVARLRALVLGVDEIALEMRGQHACGVTGRAAASARTLRQHRVERVGWARDGVGQNAVTP